jgi:hypothetical protein
MPARLAGGSQSSNSVASSSWRRTLRRGFSSIADRNLAMPFTNGSTPMKPVCG